jgi:hypothetical protein
VGTIQKLQHSWHTIAAIGRIADPIDPIDLSRIPKMSAPLDHDEIIRRISLDLADGYDEELEMEIEDRHPLSEGAGYRHIIFGNFSGSRLNW